VSVFVPVPHCLDDDSFVIELEWGTVIFVYILMDLKDSMTLVG